MHPPEKAQAWLLYFGSSVGRWQGTFVSKSMGLTEASCLTCSSCIGFSVTRILYYMGAVNLKLL